MWPALLVIASLVSLTGAAATPPTPPPLAPRQARNEFTRARPGGIDQIVVTDTNTLNGTFKDGESTLVQINSREASSNGPVTANLTINLVNNHRGGALNAYISGLDSDGRVVFLTADGNLLYPSSGDSPIPSPIEDDISIPLPPRGQTLTITLPIALSSGRVYFSEGPLSFFTVSTPSGQGIVQPSINNLEDPSSGLNWGFVELTLTTKGVIWANISFVDFVGLPFGMRLHTRGNATTQEVLGLPANAVSSICADLHAQGEGDTMPWAAHCVSDASGRRPLRVLSPNNYASIDRSSFSEYWNAYVDKVWDEFRTRDLIINTQNEQGDVSCRVDESSDELQCERDNRGYARPSAADIWSCDSGPFALRKDDSPVHFAVVPRLCAAFVRTTLLLVGGHRQPGLEAASYYEHDDHPTSHYSRIVHEREVDGRGYAFPYDDVNPDGAEDAAGLVASSDPAHLDFFIGGVEV